MRLRGLVAPEQRAYVNSHPLAFSFALGITAVGLAGLIAPQSVGQSSAALALPEWVRVALYAVLAAGGAASVLGIARGRPNFEGAGMMLVASGLAGNFLSTVYIRPTAAGSSMFVIALAVGCALRARRLATAGYSVPREEALAAVIANRGGEIIEANPAAEALFGRARDDLVGRSLTVLMPERYRARHLIGIGRAERQGSRLAGKKLLVEGLRGDGTEIPLELTIDEVGTPEDEVFYVGRFRRPL